MWVKVRFVAVHGSLTMHCTGPSAAHEGIGGQTVRQMVSCKLCTRLGAVVLQMHEHLRSPHASAKRLRRKNRRPRQNKNQSGESPTFNTSMLLRGGTTTVSKTVKRSLGRRSISILSVPAILKLIYASWVVSYSCLK